jgi:hypothetical protein
MELKRDVDSGAYKFDTDTS